MKKQEITIKEYLAQKGVEFQERGGELITACLFNGCDDDSRTNERHLYFNAEDGVYQCKKCDERGNIISLRKYFGDEQEKPSTTKPKSQHGPRFTDILVSQSHEAMPDNIRQYLNKRGIPDTVIADSKLGYGNFYGKNWITIPIKDETGEYAYFKLRQDPNEGNEKITYPKGEAQIYEWDTLKRTDAPLIICEGELDRLLLVGKGVNAITSTHGAGTFKQEWVPQLTAFQKIYVCFDQDEPGQKGAERVAKMLDNAGITEVYFVTLPDEVGEGGDVTDYFTKFGGTVDDLLGKYAKRYPERIDSTQFQPMTTADLNAVLGLTIKKDEVNKAVTFQCMLSAFTENNQFNISFNAPSSTGKSYIPLEVSTLFPADDLMKLGNASPTAFFHERGDYDKEKNTITVDLSRKIIVFLDMPNNALLERLRSLLSHDEKMIESKITDKNQKGGNRTKTVIIKGFPAVVFCSAGLKIDEQEGTRFILLSPEISQDKLREGINQRLRKESNEQEFREWLGSDPTRQLLKLRIQAIKQEKIAEIIVPDDEKETIRQYFLEGKDVLKPRHQRDIGRLIGLTKTFALLNCWFRQRKGRTIYATMDDVQEATRLWDKIAESQEHNLPPYVYDLYKDVILPAWKEKNEDKVMPDEWVGVSQQEIMRKHYTAYGTHLAEWQLRQQILPMIETAGLIIREKDDKDRRHILVCPTLKLNINESEEYSEPPRGVTDK
ncbi:MAG: toprim domain-containing protein [Candidatus Andersenbacteria bacterium]|nr:toprim domain-containing protein [Candidatus Andersenbacteria bacterium]